MLKLLGMLVLSSVVTLMSASSWAGYVCYTERYDSRTYNRVTAQYEGCRISQYSCDQQGLRHFGYYDNYRATKQALKRCVHSNPRFID